MSRICVFLTMLLCVRSACLADTYAFLVGVSDYSANDNLNSLKYAENDVHTLARTLHRHNVPRNNIVLMSHDMVFKKARWTPSSNRIRKEFDLLIAELTDKDSLIVGFSGHGIQFQGEEDSYFCPSDADPKKKSTLISLKEIYTRLEDCPARSKLMLVDACRDDPLASNAKTAGRIKLKPVVDRKPPVFSGGTVAMFSCSPGQQSFESKEIGAGVFFHFVNRALSGEADVNADQIVDSIELQAFAVEHVQSWARIELGQLQIPETQGRVRGRMPLIHIGKGANKNILVRKLNPVPPPGPAPAAPRPQPSAPAPDAMQFANGIGMKLRRIPKGSFLMGSPTDEPGRVDNEAQHRVVISKPFYMSQTEVTLGQFREFCTDSGYQTEAERDGIGGFGINVETNEIKRHPLYNWKYPGFLQSEDHPVVNVSWNDATKFCEWLSEREGRLYTLPSEAQWEFACRGGTHSMYHNGADPSLLTKVGNVADETAKTRFTNWNVINAKDGFVFTAPVGRFTPNRYGLHDMHGNVWEWCRDWFGGYGVSPEENPTGPAHGTQRVFRGGSWYCSAQRCRAAMRSSGRPSDKTFFLGFRVQTEL